MGVVNVTPDSFSDGGRFLDPGRRGRARARPGARRRGDPRRRRRVHPPRRRAGGRRRGAAARGARHRGGRAPPATGAQISVDTSKVARRRGRGRRGRHLRQRRHRLPPRPGPRRARRRARPGLLPDAHAGRAAHDAGRPALRRRRLRRARVPRGAARLRGGGGESGRSGSCSTPASASARRSTTTSSCCAGSTSSSRSGARSCSAPRASRFLGKITGRELDDRIPGTDRDLRARATSAARSVFRVHDVAAVHDALLVTAATVTGRWSPTSPSASPTTTTS